MWTGESNHSYSLLGRVVLRFEIKLDHSDNVVRYDLTCCCKVKGCTHKPIAKWYLMETKSDILSSSESSHSSGFHPPLEMDCGYSATCEYVNVYHRLPYEIPDQYLNEVFQGNVLTPIPIGVCDIIKEWHCLWES